MVFVIQFFDIKIKFEYFCVIVIYVLLKKYGLVK